MAFLEQFSGPEKALLVALPYRAGLWVSQSDATGGKTADAQELQALSRIIEAKARGMFRSAFVHEVMAETYGRRTEWKQWADGVERVPDECRHAMVLLEKKLIERDILAYRQTVMTIADDVARAFREHDENVGMGGRLLTMAGIMIDKLIGVFRGEEYESTALLNISEKEDLALGTLAAALRMDQTP
ncbi:MAG: hypothetical protein KJ667_07665 [Alphaproteobacteria bacterium]|nr:hypothetical protein [Alphaproteobacteria bacterium]